MTSTLQDVKRQLLYIDSSFIGDNEVRNVFLGKDAETSDFVKDITNYTNFKKYFDTTKTGVLNLANVKVKAKTPNASFIPLTDAKGALGNNLIHPANTTSSTDSIVTNANNSFETMFDINFGNVTFLVNRNPPKIDKDSAPMNALDMLNSFTAAYNLLETATFKVFKTNGSITVKNYEGTVLNVAAQGSNSTLREGNVIINRVLKIDAISSDTTIARTDAVRRVFLGYIYLIEIYIAAYMYETNTDTANYTTKNILETCIKKFIALNESMYNTTTTDGIGKLYTGLEQRMNEYKTSKSVLNNLAVTIDKTKSGITLEQNSINSHTSFLETNQRAFYAFMILFLVLLVLVMYTYYGPISASIKQKVMVGITALSLVVLVIAFLVYKFVVIEPFEQRTPLQLYNEISIGVFSEYLTHTINVLRLLDTYRSYGEISQSIRKESNYYTNVAEELKLNKGELNSVQAERLRQGKILRYRTYLFIQILITICFLMLLLSYQYNILYIIIAAFIILVWVYFYVFNMNNLVRTDAKKFYWGQPVMS